MTISPEAFMAQPTEPDEDLVDLIPQLVTGSAGDITLTSVEQMVDILPGPLHYIAEYLRQIAEHFNGTGTQAQVAQESAEIGQALREQHDDLLAEHVTLRALLEEIETIVKPSTSKLANQVRLAIKAWRDPEVEPDVPAHDADVEEWREYAHFQGHARAVVEAMNRSQIRTALGIPQPEGGA